MGKKTEFAPTLYAKFRQFLVVGRQIPTEANPEPTIFRMRVYCRNEVLAKSKFWYFMRKLNKVKKTNGEVLEVNEIREPNGVKVRNFGIWLRYDSRTGTHNMYKEFRDVSETGAVSQLFAEMAGNHRARSNTVQIVRVHRVKDTDCRRNHITQLHKSKLRFPVIRRIPLQAKEHREIFLGSRPTTFVR